MQTHNVKQGTPEWKTLRDKHDTASEASAMMGDSKYMTRDQLMKQKHIGEAEPVTPQLQTLFDRGHATEAAIRPHIEKIINQELFPVTGTLEVEGLKLLASFDGLSMDDTIVFEHKLWNEDLAEQVRNGELHEHYKWQLDQQLYVSGANEAIFVTSDGTPDQMEYCWYRPDADRFARLLNGWKQFKEDLANYVYTPEPELIKAESVLSLPAVSIKVDGTIALIDNLDVFGEALEGYIARINKAPETDQDFANLEAAVKTLKSAENALTAAENGALAQATDIDTMRRTVDLYRSIARDNRLIFDNVVKTQKEVIKTAIFQEDRDALMKHVSLLNEGLGAQYVQYNADFKAVMKGKRTITTLRSAANDELARAKIEANEQAEKYRANLKTLNHAAADHKFLFNDMPAIIGKEPADFVLLVNDRVAKHKQAEEEKLEVERERIRKEEQDRLAREQAEEAARIERERIAEEGRLEDERLIAEEKARKAETVVEPEPAPEPAPTSKPVLVSDTPKESTSQPVFTIQVTDKRMFLQSVIAGSADLEDVYINTDRLTEKAYRLNGNLSIPGIKVEIEKVG